MIKLFLWIFTVLNTQYRTQEKLEWRTKWASLANSPRGLVGTGADNWRCGSGSSCASDPFSVSNRSNWISPQLTWHSMAIDVRSWCWSPPVSFCFILTWYNQRLRSSREHRNRLVMSGAWDFRSINELFRLVLGNGENFFRRRFGPLVMPGSRCHRTFVFPEFGHGHSEHRERQAPQCWRPLRDFDFRHVLSSKPEWSIKLKFIYI
jgi:hypothetical protein